MKTLCRKANNLIRTFDLFPCTQFLRYKGDSSYKTTTGGCLSIALMILFTVMFFNMGFSTMRKEIIYSSLNIQKKSVPSPTTMNFVEEEGFMFALAIQYLDLNDPNLTFFDIELRQSQIGTGFVFNQQSVPLVACTEQHFNFTTEIKETYQSNNGYGWLCPPIGQNLTVDGRLLAANYEYFEIKIKKCNSTLRNNCANETQIQDRLGGQFRIGLMLVSNVLNPDDEIYHQTSIDSRNTFYFSTTSAVEVEGYIQEVVIDTDQSLWPIQDILSQRFLTIDEMLRQRSRNVVDNTYARIKFVKSPIQRTFKRSFNKLDTFFSYVGGILGISIAVISILISYFEKAFTISVASQLFVSQSDEPISSTGFHICYLPMLLLKNFLNWIGACKDGWKQTDFYQKCLTETEEQLDVISIMKKLIFIEKALSLLFTNHQLEALHLFQKQRIDEAEQKRKKYDLEARLNKTEVAHIRKANGSQGESVSSNFSENNEIKYSGSQIVPISGELSAASVSRMEIGSQNRIKTQLIRLKREANRGNHISNQILSELSPQVLAKMGLNEVEIDEVVSKVELRRASVSQFAESGRTKRASLRRESAEMAESSTKVRFQLQDRVVEDSSSNRASQTSSEDNDVNE